MPAPTNASRARRAQTALHAYADANGEQIQAETVVDLLTDLHHYLAAQGDTDPIASIDQECVAAAEHFAAEAA